MAGLPTTTLECLRAEEKQEYFRMATQCVKKIVQVFDAIKDNVDCNVQYSASGLYIFSLYYDKTVCIVTNIGKSLFSEYTCSDTPVLATYNLNVLAKKMTVLQKFKPEKLVFSNQGADLVIKGESTGKAPSEISVSALSSSVEELDVNSFTYSIYINIPSSDLAQVIESMPLLFLVKMDCENRCLRFIGEEDQSSISLSINFPADVVARIRQVAEMRNFQASFLKSYLQPISKGSKLSSQAVLSFTDGAPLFVRFIIQQSLDLQNCNDTDVTMYFASRYDDEDY